MRTEYATLLNGEVLYEGEDFQKATATWNAATYAMSSGEALTGGISVQEFRSDGCMVRDGWILHIRPNKTPYISFKPY